MSKKSETISTLTPELSSMQYAALRQIALDRVQLLSGNIWTDYNYHDPGVTMMELLCYATTDLGYRLTFDLADLLTNEPGDTTDYKNFFTAREILHTAPINIRDFRKLLMDVAVSVTGIKGEEEIGIKNAWLLVSDEAEVKLFTDNAKKELSYIQKDANDAGFYTRGLYNILLEFDNSKNFGDLNSQKMEGTFLLSGLANPELNGVEIQVAVNFPGWDEKGINWSVDAEIKSKIDSITVEFKNVPEGFNLTEVNSDNAIIELQGTHIVSGNPVVLPELNDIKSKIEQFIYSGNGSLMAQYKQKVAIQRSIVKSALCRLQENRPLCEDFYKVLALKVEEIAFCGDIVLSGLADPTEVAAVIYKNISEFLSPNVYFYDLTEMQQKQVKSENRTIKIDEIFNGPALQHGFIFDDELDESDQVCNIRASDIINLIMNTEIDGVKPVKAVRGLQLANFPEDNDGTISEKIVKWCLQLAISKFYVPRLSVSLSEFTFYKENLPFSVNKEVVKARIAELKETDRKRYPTKPILDKSIPKGSWRETTDFTSVQEDLPMTYGVGSPGIPNLPNDYEARTARQSYALQLKEFLSFFDQVFYNYLQQLSGIKSLFSMNESTNEFGDLLMDKTYFSKPLVGKKFNELNADPADDNSADVTNVFVIPDIVPGASELQVFTNNYDGLDHKIAEIAESEELFVSRKNRFLDHLLARFCEQFSDYALLQYSMEGPKAGIELIGDKLAFLNSYPRISAFRGTAFNYADAKTWHINNVSGFEDRCALLMGMNKVKESKLSFSLNFDITNNASGWNYVYQVGPNKLLKNLHPFASKNELLIAIEKTVSSGVLESNYSIIENSPGSGKYHVNLGFQSCGTDAIAKSFKADLTLAEAKDLVHKCVKDLLDELVTHIPASRKNLTPPIFDYFKVISHVEDNSKTPHLHTIEYVLYDRLNYLPGKVELLKGVLEGPETPGKNAAETNKFTEFNLLWKLIRYASDKDCYRFVPPSAAPFPATYHFEIFDLYSNALGEDKNSNYNLPLANVIKNTVNGKITVSDSSLNNGIYKIADASADGPYIHIKVVEPIPGIVADGKAVFTQSVDCVIDSPNRKLTVNGTSLTESLFEGEHANIVSAGNVVQTVTIRSIEFVSGNTVIVVSDELEKNTGAKLEFSRTFQIKKISGQEFIVNGEMEIRAVEKLTSFINKKFIDKEGIHLIEHILLRPKAINKDLLFAINTDDDCEDCKLSDVYSFVMTVVLPYWPDRFMDLNFRSLIEKTIRKEAPAHLALNICWVSPLDMFQFEETYKTWLYAINTFNDDDFERIQALRKLIQTIMKLRTVYPEGRLFDCDETVATKNPVILNQTQLGTF